MDHDKAGHDPLTPARIRTFTKRYMGKQAVVLAVVEKQELGEDSLPAPQKCTTGTAITFLKGDSGVCVWVGEWGGIRKIKANCIPF